MEDQKKQRNLISKKQMLFYAVLVLIVVQIARCMHTPGLRELKRLCTEEAGELIPEPIEVEGFFHASEDDCSGCKTYLSGGNKYQFIEWFHTKKASFMKDAKLDEYYRLYISSKVDANCNWKFGDMRKHPDFDYCFAIKQIDKSELLSEYSYGHESKARRVAKYAVMHAPRTEIRHLKSGELFSYYQRYTLYPQKNSAFNPGHAINCKDVEGGFRFTKASFPTSILIQKQD